MEIKSSGAIRDGNVSTLTTLTLGVSGWGLWSMCVKPKSHCIQLVNVVILYELYRVNIVDGTANWRMFDFAHKKQF